MLLSRLEARRLGFSTPPVASCRCPQRRGKHLVEMAVLNCRQLGHFLEGDLAVNCPQLVEWLQGGSGAIAWKGGVRSLDH